MSQMDEVRKLIEQMEAKIAAIKGIPGWEDEPGVRATVKKYEGLVNTQRMTLKALRDTELKQAVGAALLREDDSKLRDLFSGPNIQRLWGECYQSVCVDLHEDGSGTINLIRKPECSDTTRPSTTLAKGERGITKGQVIEMTRNGLSRAEIARKLDIRPQTVKRHIDEHLAKHPEDSEVMKRLSPAEQAEARRAARMADEPGNKE